MVKMLLTNYYLLQLWIYLCCVLLVSTENLSEINLLTHTPTDVTNLSPFASTRLASTAFEPIKQQGNSPSQTMITKSYDAPDSSEISLTDEQMLPSSPLFSLSTPEDSTEIKSVVPTVNKNFQGVSSRPTFSQVLFSLSRNSPFQGFSYLLRSLDSYSIPPVLMDIQSTVMNLIRLNFLRVREILDYLQRYSHLQETDLAIMGLIMLAETLPRYCELRIDIQELSSAVVLLKLINQPPVEPKCIKEIVKVENPIKCDCKPEIETTKSIYLNRSSTDTTLTNSVLYSVSKSEESTVTVTKQTLLKAITIPLIPEVEYAYNVTKSFIENSANFEILKQLTINSTSSQQLLLQFYAIIKQQTTISIEIKQEILKYTDYVLGRYIPVTPTPEIRFDFGVLLDILPNPADDIEEQYLSSLRIALRSEEAYVLIKESGLESVTDQRKQLIEVLKLLQAKYSSTDIKEAVKYYLEYLEKLESLTLIGTKKIEKRFDLTGIFSDTLQLGSLPSAAKLAFKKIYKYIANMHGNEMENFNEWNEASTRAQFIQYLFNYFLAQNFVPSDVKIAVKTLIPFIQKDGKGALPP